ncbi:MAG: homoserine kinase, partial [Atopobium sp.]|nr:homoserine kinase [Atopobium sp.]
QVRGDLWIQILEPALLGTVLTLDDGQQHHNTFDEI